MTTSETLYRGRVFCPLTRAALPVRVVADDAGGARLQCLGFSAEICRGRRALTGDDATHMEARLPTPDDYVPPR